MNKDYIAIKGDRYLWFDFICILKKNKKQVWEFLEPLIKDYIKNADRFKNKTKKKQGFTN